MSESVHIKPRVRVQAGSQPVSRALTGDSFLNLAASLGYGAVNLSSGSTYGFAPLSRNRTLLEWAYRGSWLVRKIVDAPAEDMTRQGIHVESDMPPDRIDELTQYLNSLMLWQRLCSTIKWARLYGGAIGVIMIDGQRLDTPLRPETVGRGQFKGLLVLDRWMVWPHLEDLVTDFGADFGLPRFYDVVADARSIPRMRIHHSRCVRFGGAELPYWQKIAENEWDLSVLEPFYDRMIAYDSATQGAAQLIYKAHLRVLQIENYRELIAAGGPLYQSVVQQLNMIRLMQSNEGMTVLDSKDVFSAQQYSFAGLSDMMIQFATQVSGAADIPITRLFGQSPAGMNATGDADLRNYYDAIKSRQEAVMRRPITMLLDIAHRSKFGVELPRGFNWSFAPLWQLTENEKAGIAAQITGAVDQAVAGGIVDQLTALKELRQSSRITGVWSNITDETISAAEEAAANPPLPEMPGAPGTPNALGGPGGLGGQPRLTGPGQEAGASPVAAIPPGSEEPPGTAEGGPQQDDSAEALESPAVHIHVGGRGPDFGEPAAQVHVGGAEEHPEPAFSVTTDHLAMHEVHGIPIVIETQKGQQRLGYGWAVSMPSHYGYIQGTSSPEGPREQTDCFLGDNPQSRLAYVINQVNPDTRVFDEYKIMLGFDSRDAALNCYHAAFNDGRGAERLGSIQSMDVDALKTFLKSWPYGKGEGRPKLRAV